MLIWRNDEPKQEAAPVAAPVKARKKPPVKKQEAALPDADPAKAVKK